MVSVLAFSRGVSLLVYPYVGGAGLSVVFLLQSFLCGILTISTTCVVDVCTAVCAVGACGGQRTTP